MKRIRVLPDPTPGLAEYLDTVDNPSWEEFRAHNAGASLRELRNALAQNQHGVCAYCEIELRESRRQIEHVVPRSDETAGTQRALDVTNMVACCMGGTVPAARAGESDGGDHYREPVPDNMSCGQAKENRNGDAFADPRELRAVPSLMSVLDSGLIEVDVDACQAEGVAPDRVTRTIDILNLNAERLQLARAKWWNDLIDESQHVQDAEAMGAWIQVVLTPDEDGRLLRFFTTSRCFFGPVAERILDEQPQAWV